MKEFTEPVARTRIAFGQRHCTFGVGSQSHQRLATLAASDLPELVACRTRLDDVAGGDQDLDAGREQCGPLKRVGAREGRRLRYP